MSDFQFPNLKGRMSRVKSRVEQRLTVIREMAAVTDNTFYIGKKFLTFDEIQKCQHRLEE